jgi:hypothetical protein
MGRTRLHFLRRQPKFQSRWYLSRRRQIRLLHLLRCRCLLRLHQLKK